MLFMCEYLDCIYRIQLIVLCTPFVTTFGKGDSPKKIFLYVLHNGIIHSLQKFFLPLETREITPTILP